MFEKTRGVVFVRGYVLIDIVIPPSSFPLSLPSDLGKEKRCEDSTHYFFFFFIITRDREIGRSFFFFDPSSLFTSLIFSLSLLFTTACTFIYFSSSSLLALARSFSLSLSLVFLF